MQLEPRFIFRGNAFGFGGQIREPAVPYFEVHAPTSLPTVGGVSRAEVRGQDFAKVVNFGLARSEALGGVSDFRTTTGPANTILVPNQRQMTVVRASLFDLLVESRLNIKLMSMALRSYEVAGEEQPWIIPEETMITTTVPREVLQLMAEGLSTTTIAERLDLDLDVVRDYVRQAVVQLGHGSRTRSILVAFDQGLIETQP